MNSCEKLVKHILCALDGNGVTYVIIRRAENLSEIVPGDDVDINVAEEEMQQAIAILILEAQRHQAIVLSKARLPGIYQLVLAVPTESSGLALVRFDIQTALRHKGVMLMSGAMLLANRRRFDGVWRPAASVEGVGLLLHDIVTKKGFRNGDLDKIRRLRDDEPVAFEKVLADRVGVDAAKDIITLLCTGRDDGLIAIRLRVVRLLLLPQWIKYCAWQTRETVSRGALFFRRRGVLVSFLGPDGSGKTTLLNSVAAVLSGAGLKVQEAYFGTPTPLLPTKWVLRKLRHRGKDAQSQRDSAHVAGSFRQELNYFLGSLHTLLDLYLRYMVHVRIYLSRARIVLCDRYFYDLMINPAPRPVHAWFWGYLKSFVPRPDKVFVLMDAAASIHERKPELLVEEIERQQAIFLQLSDEPIGAYIVNVEPDIRSMAFNASLDVLRAYAARNA